MICCICNMIMINNQMYDYCSHCNFLVSMSDKDFHIVLYTDKYRLYIDFIYKFSLIHNVNPFKPILNVSVELIFDCNSDINSKLENYILLS